MLHSGATPEAVVARIEQGSAIRAAQLARSEQHGWDAGAKAFSERYSEFAAGLDISPATLDAMNDSGVPEIVLLAMIDSLTRYSGFYLTRPLEFYNLDKLRPREQPTQDASRIADEAAELKARCPDCRRLYFAEVPAVSPIRVLGTRIVPVETSELKSNQLAAEQLKLLIREKHGKRKGDSSFVVARYPQNADILVLHLEAGSLRAYIRTTEAPVTCLQDLKVSLSVEESEVAASQSFVTVVLIERENGRRLFEKSCHGNWVWSKPEAECLLDAFHFLAKQRR
jgi:hypothetical protein